MDLTKVSLLIMTGLLTACASMSDMQQRFAVCSYDHAWEAALEAVKDRAINTKDKNGGLIVTGWLEIPMPGRTFGALQRDVGDSRDRSRITLTVKRLDDVTKISFVEERQRWAFRGGSRLFGWASTDPSDDVMRDVQSRLDTKLKEHKCSLS
ncbi:MAG: hypothetical protein Q8L74_17465 [Nitrospirota bacterium]|nr:hypothetical protein [Nitrospirota bacterium]MDP2382942.1 hypothetical protein [Nitrospirota bacterium]MDP3598018.1 hypothetical protein [Nitrospirota bacterium]